MFRVKYGLPRRGRKPITNPISEDKKNIADAIDFMHLFLDRIREICATTDTITFLQGYAAKQGVLGQ